MLQKIKSPTKPIFKNKLRQKAENEESQHTFSLKFNQTIKTNTKANESFKNSSGKFSRISDVNGDTLKSIKDKARVDPSSNYQLKDKYISKEPILEESGE